MALELLLSHVASAAHCTYQAPVFVNRPRCDLRPRPHTRAEAAGSDRVVLSWSDLYAGDFNRQVGAQRVAAELGLLRLRPHEPARRHIPRDPAGSYYFRPGAVFYGRFTQETVSRNYRIELY